MIKMRNKKQHRLQREKMKPNATTSYKSPLDMVRHNGFVLLSKGGPIAVLIPVPSMDCLSGGQTSWFAQD